MRRRLVVSTIAIVLVVLGALAVPIGIIVHRAAESELRGRLEEQGGEIATALTDRLLEGAEPDFAALRGLVSAGDGIRIVAADGEVLLDHVPSTIRNPLVVSRVGPEGMRIDLIADSAPLDERFREQVLILLALAGGALIAAAALAAIQGRQLARPLERVAATASRFGDGDFSASNLPATDIPEIDRISGALRQSGAQVAQMLAAERHFTADATHQLRTGITGIAMRFELLARHTDTDVASEAEAGLAQTDQLNVTIDELLAVARGGAQRVRTDFDLVAVVDDHVAEWNPRFAALRRTIAVTTDRPARVVGTKGLAGQVIDILIDNALRHGRGATTVHVSGSDVTVGDEGPGLSADQVDAVFDTPSDPAARHGRGLPLARRLAEVDGGGIDIVATRPLRVRYRLVGAAAQSPTS